MRVCIDFGHGGKSPGAVANGLIEKNLNREAGEFLRDELTRCGVEVLLSRVNDDSADLSQRASLINSINPDYVISIHHNAGGGEGAEIQKIHRIYSKKSSRSDEDYYAIIREVKSPSVIIEIGFLDNTKDAEKIKKPYFERMTARSVAMGFCDFAGIKYIQENTAEKSRDTDDPHIYRVQVGAFSSRGNAEKLVRELMDKGYSAFIKEDNIKYK